MNRACTSLVAEKKKKKTATGHEDGEDGCDDMDVEEEAATEEGGSQGNGAFVVKSDEFASRKMKDIMSKMQSCITWTKKSSVGWKAMRQAAKVRCA
jgi:hypothetical protein